MHNKRLLIILAVLMVVILPIVTETSSAMSSREINGATLSTFDNNVNLQAGQSGYVNIDVYNSNSTTTVVGIETSAKGITVRPSVNEISVDSGKMSSFKIYIETDKLMNHGTYGFVLTVTVYDFGSANYEEGTLTFNVNITSVYSDGSGFNMIMGLFPPLPSPLDTVPVTVTITLVAWLAISILIYMMVMVVVHFVFSKEEVLKKTVNHGTGSLLVLAVMVYGVSNALSVAGASDALIASAKSITRILYILMAAGIVWNIYHSVLEMVFHRLEERKRLEGVDTSLIPLFRMLGTLVIWLVTISAVLSVLGFDLAAIITGMGVAGVAISLGAQSTLTQFFSGLNIVLNRPFKIGDMVMIGSDKNIYEVKKLSIMNTTFKNWANQEYCIMPNDTVASSRIVNVTGETIVYRMFLYFYSSYDADTELTKKLIMEEAYKNPNVVTDGSYSIPEVRVEDFDASAIKYRLAVYINDFRNNVKVTGQLNEAVYNALLDAGIGCPYDINDIYIFREE